MAAFPAHRTEGLPAVTGPESSPSTTGGSAVRRTTAVARPPAPSPPPGPLPGPATGPTTRATVPALPRLRVRVTRSAPDDAGRFRWSLDTAGLAPAPARRLHALVDDVEAAGPAGRPGIGSRRPDRSPGAPPSYEVTVARGFGHWTVHVAEGLAAPALRALIDAVRGAPERS